MNKRGVSNIEFVLAFIMFVGFVVAALYFFNPTRNLKAVELSRDYVANEIIKNCSVELDSYSIIVNSYETKLKVSIPGIASNKRARVEDYYGAKLTAAREGDRVCFQRKNAEFKDFVTVHFSEDFEEREDIDCSGISEEGYSVASSAKENVISENRMIKLIENYDNDYESLKKALNVPDNIDFSFTLEFPGGYEMSAEKKTPLRVEIFSETELREVIKQNGESEFAYLTVRVW